MMVNVGMCMRMKTLRVKPIRSKTHNVEHVYSQRGSRALQQEVLQTAVNEYDAALPLRG